MSVKPKTNPQINGKPMSFVRLVSKADRYTVKPDSGRRGIKDGIKVRKAAKRTLLRRDHQYMTHEGIPRRLNGGKLGHHRRTQMLKALTNG